MPEIFVSYARKDNEPYPAITHQVTEAIDHFLQVYRYVQGIEEGTPEEDPFFVDRASLDPGDRIPERIRRAIVDCPVMLAFYSPHYFRSRYCFHEWCLFRTEQQDERAGSPRRLLVPIEVRPVRPEEVNPFAAEVPEWVEELVTGNGLHRNITSEILLDRDTRRLASEIRTLASTIDRHLEAERGTSPDRRATPNIHVIGSPVKNFSFKGGAIRGELNTARAKYDWPPVCVIYAGGTVGMIQVEESDALHTDFRMAAGFGEFIKFLRPKLADLPFDIHCFSLAKPIDSSNVAPADWNGLARLIREQMQRYQGFVILHGTNTMCYSASALSFLLNDVLDRPVILTGSEVPISVLNTDAVHNVENAVRAAAWQSHNGPLRVPEVCVYWNNHLLRGNRAAKKVASDRVESFHSPNMPTPLGALTHDRIDIEHSLVLERETLRSHEAPLSPAVDLDAKVGVLFVYPNMDLDHLDEKYPDDLDGLILLSYGPGNAPDDRRFIEMVTRLHAAGTVIGNITQCPYGRVELMLFETSATLFDLGVVDGYDMTLEAAYCKLMWALSRFANRRKPGAQARIKQLFQRNVAGEMSVSIYTLSLGSGGSFQYIESKECFVSDVVRFEEPFSPYDITQVFVRLEGFRLEGAVTTAQLRLFYGQPSESWQTKTATPNLLADFTKVLLGDELERRRFDKNLNVTHSFRKNFSNEDFQVSVACVGNTPFTFSSMKLVVYTKNRRVR